LFDILFHNYHAQEGVAKEGKGEMKPRNGPKIAIYLPTLSAASAPSLPSFLASFLLLSLPQLQRRDVVRIPMTF
jgi:hypothetical protein